MRWISYFILPLIYVLIGGFVTAWLVQLLLGEFGMTWLVVLIPLMMITIFITVVGVVNVWLHYRAWRDACSLRVYGMGALLWLYFRCWVVVISGLTLGVVFYWIHDLVSADIRLLLDNLKYVFYIFCVLLTVASLMSIVLGEDLHEIRLRNTQSENQLLKSQLNPHFLYNTLNNIDALIWLDQEQASKAVNSLSDLMRYLTYSARQEQVSLGEEIENIRRFIELQLMRFQNKEALSFVVNMPESCNKLTIAPLLLMPLLENCFKHCGRIDETDAIVISLTVDESGILYFTTNNNLKPDSEETIMAESRKRQGGVGMTVLRRRLSILYNGQYDLKGGKKDNRYEAELRLVL